MKNYFKIIIVSLLLCLSFFSISQALAFDFSDLIDDGGTEIHYCNDDDDECGIDEGIKEVGQNVEGIVVDQTASSYFQNVISYLMGFLYLIAVALIIYSGFNILTSVGEEEKVKKSKTIIIYSIIGIVIIFLASTLISFVINVLNQADEEVITYLFK